MGLLIKAELWERDKLDSLNRIEKFSAKRTSHVGHWF